MAKKFVSGINLTPKELAQHLRQPTGEIGRQVGLEMNKGNKHICLNAYKVLKPKSGDHILEIGMGNGFFVQNLLGMAEHLYYTGVDISAIMLQEARRINKEQIDLGRVRFEKASVEQLPFGDDSFDCITTTNTLYFWPHVESNLKELWRVLKPGGKLLIAYRSKSCLDQIKFTKHGFNKFAPEEVEKLLPLAGFTEVNTEVIKEPKLDYDGKPLEIEGIYTFGSKR